MGGYIPAKLDPVWTGRYGPTHMPAPAGAPKGPGYVPSPGYRDYARIGRQYNKTSLLSLAAKGLGGLTMLSSFPHVIISGWNGFFHFASYFTSGLILFKLPWAVRHSSLKRTPSSAAIGLMVRCETRV